MSDDEKLAIAIERAGFPSFEAAEDEALKLVNEHVAKYGDRASSTLAFAVLKAAKHGPESREMILARLAQIILSEAR
jgi:hypothetical protein